MVSRPAWPLLLAVSFLFVASSANGIVLFIKKPGPTEVVFGEIEVEVEVVSGHPVAEVLFELDGKFVGRLTQPPYRLLVDTGPDNHSRVFEITARDTAGESVTETLTTKSLRIDSEIELELQQLFVTVTQGARRTLDLAEHVFEILDNGQRQRIVTFEPGGTPVTAVVLVDTSFSMRGGRLQAALSGVRTFIRDLQPLDLAKVILFSDSTLVNTAFSADTKVLDHSIHDLEAAHGSAINDHLYMALKSLEEQEGRPVIVLLSDGVDVESVLEIEDVFWKARRSQALVFWIRPDALPPDQFNFYSRWRDPEGHRRNIKGLAEMVHESGGRVFDVQGIDEVPAVFAEIAAELREQYVFGYYPTVNLDDGAWHKVEVRARGAQTRTRKGYQDVRR